MNPLSLVARPRRGGLSASTHVTLLVAAVLIPSLLLALLVANQLVKSTRAQTQQTTLQIARDVAADVDRKLLNAKQLLKVFANSHALQIGDTAGFERQAYEFAEQTGLQIALRTSSNKILIHTAAPRGTVPAIKVDALDETVSRVVRQREIVVTNLIYGQLGKRFLIFVTVPVLQYGTVAYVLSAVMPASLLSTATDRIPTAAGFRGGVIDGSGRIAIRNPGRDDDVGMPASDDVLKKAIGEKGTWTGMNADGVPVFGAYYRLHEADWIASVGVYQSSFNEPLYEILKYIAVAGACLLVGGLLAAYVIGRHISVAFQVLGKAGEALLRKEVVQPAATRVWEADQAAQSLSEASQNFRRADEHIRFAAEAAGFGTWVWDATPGLVTMSDLGASMFGLAGAGPYLPETIVDCVTAADRPVLMDAFKACLKGRPFLETELRVADGPQGPPRWVRVIGRVDFAADGRAERMLGIVQNVSSQKHAQEVRLELLRRLMTAEERERLRLSRELHDHTGQSITAALLEIKALEAVIPTQSRGRLRRLRGDLEDMSRDLHRLATELRATSLVDVGLDKVLANYVADWGARTGIRADFHATGRDLAYVPEAITTSIYRIVQEALTNIVKHAAGATAVSVLLDNDDDQLRLTIEDNGCGFDATSSDGSVDVISSGRLGLAGIRERLMLISGDLEIESSPSAGTTMFVRIELKRERVPA